MPGLFVEIDASERQRGMGGVVRGICIEDSGDVHEEESWLLPTEEHCAECWGTDIETEWGVLRETSFEGFGSARGISATRLVDVT
jgi:hypothetical protein